MADKTGIEWTDATWNPIRGCTRVSEGCRNCYAEGLAYRFSGPGQPYEGLVQVSWDGKRRQQWNGVIRFVDERLLDPLRWKPGRRLYDNAGKLVGRDTKQPMRIFVNSMSDLFHENVTDEMLDRIFAVMALCPQHTFQVLTKRPERMLAYLNGGEPGSAFGLVGGISGRSWRIREAGHALVNVPQDGRVTFALPLPNVWLGVTVENQKAADERRQATLAIAALSWIIFTSCEPLLSKLDMSGYLRVSWQCSGCRRYFSGGYQTICPNCKRESCWSGSHAFNPKGGQTGTALRWVIVGGESGKGPGIRPMHPAWVRSVRDQCAAAGVPFFFKQWGEWAPEARRGQRDLACLLNGDCEPYDPQVRNKTQKLMFRVGKKAAGDLLDGLQHHEFPEVR